jgi:hypothetical protein
MAWHGMRRRRGFQPAASVRVPHRHGVFTSGPASSDDVKRINGLLANEIQMTEIVSIGASVVTLAVRVLGLGTLVLLTVVILNRRATLNQVNASLP